MRHFADLRPTPWFPTFSWVSAPNVAADRINLPHEDYPLRVERTEKTIFWLREVIEKMKPPYVIQSSLLLDVHQRVFGDKSFAGQWRNVNPRVGPHRPPHFELVPKLMQQLEACHEIRTTQDLEDWYYDFETIHPFQDGNGRVGGIVVATFSWVMEMESKKGLLSPNQ